jgi:hypothetical protein
VYHHVGDGNILTALRLLSEKVEQIMNALETLQAAVAAESTVVDSAITLLEGLAKQVAELKPNQAAIDALAADITAKTTALSDAVVANTPASETPAEPKPFEPSPYNS